MKKYLVLIIATTALWGCKKNTEEDNGFHPVHPNYYGTVTAIRNGKSFSGKIIAGATFDSTGTGKLFLNIDDLRDGFYWDQFRIGNIPIMIGSFQITKDMMNNSNAPKLTKEVFAYYNGSFDFGSDAVSLGHMDTSSPHYVSISKYDSVTKEVWGTFEITFVKDYQSKYTNRVDYANGSFYTKIQ